MTEEEKTDPNEQPQEPQEAAAAGDGTPRLEPAPLKAIVGTKVGMTKVFRSNTEMVPVTVISAEGVTVTHVKTQQSDGYNSVQVGYGFVPERKLSKGEVGHFTKKGLKAQRFLHEFRVPDAAPFKVGQIVPVTVFSAGDWVQVTGRSKGKGFAGGLKRHGFHGGPHSHGHGEYRRAPGSSGGQGPQHVLPGTRKPGHLGDEWITEPKVEVVDLDMEKNLVVLRGSVPGPNGNFVILRPTNKKVPQKKASSQGSKKKGKR